MSELGGSQHWKDAKEKIDRIHRDRVYVEELNVDSSKTDITRHPGSIFIHTPPHHAQQHKYFARFDKNGIIALYDGFFAITTTEERADYFLEAFFRGIAGAEDCANPDPKCAASYIKLSQRISKKSDSASGKKDKAGKDEPASSPTKEVSGGSQANTQEQRPASSLKRQPSNRVNGVGRGGYGAGLRRTRRFLSSCVGLQ
ncbi:hypothetical protein BJ165DRAFT_739861 [Panaeolus papilionaceus]|nr:hypothetical protein BJ165DRAFT_739861 [Panaeolus papilionaceus]